MWKKLSLPNKFMHANARARARQRARKKSGKNQNVRRINKPTKRHSSKKVFFSIIDEKSAHNLQQNWEGGKKSQLKVAVRRYLRVRREGKKAEAKNGRWAPNYCFRAQKVLKCLLLRQLLIVRLLHFFLTLLRSFLANVNFTQASFVDSFHWAGFALYTIKF